MPQDSPEDNADAKRSEKRRRESNRRSTPEIPSASASSGGPIAADRDGSVPVKSKTPARKATAQNTAARKATVGQASPPTAAPKQTPQAVTDVPPSSSTPRKQPATRTRTAPVKLIESEEEEVSVWQEMQQEIRVSLPAFLCSLFVHLVLLVLLAVIALPVFSPDVLDLTFSIGEDNLPTIDDLMDDSFEVNLGEFETVVEVEELDVEPPQISLPVMTKRPDATLLDPLQELSLKSALSGRATEAKEALLQEFGGTSGTENAVEQGLEWLAKNQTRDGTWSLKGPFRDGTILENRSAATAMALLAFLGAGHTHDRGDYQREVQRGLDALLKRQGFDGDFYQLDGSQSEIPNHHLYTHAQGMIVVCELLAMTGDESLREPAQKAIAFAEQAQASEGGWRYVPGEQSDLSVTGWFVLGLQSGRMAGLEIQPNTWAGIEKFIESVHCNDNTQFLYRPLEPTPRLAMTAEGLLCGQYLGWKRDDEAMSQGVAHLRSNLMDWDDKNFYYWYYAAQVLHNVEGEAWDEWNEIMREAIPTHQVQSGREKGSWDPEGDRYAMSGGGRLYATCLCLLTLEVYYRHLPIYRYSIQ